MLKKKRKKVVYIYSFVIVLVYLDDICCYPDNCKISLI